MRTLYISYFGALKHLSQTQVIPYLKGLAEGGVEVTLVSFEERWNSRTDERAARQALREELHRAGVEWLPLRYHKRPSLPATAWDVLRGLLVASYVVVRKRVDVIHARNHVPAVPALILKHLFRRKLVFDLRGTMAEEYVDAGLWRRTSVAYRVTRLVERAALRHADAVVMLTYRIRSRLVSQLPELHSHQAKIQVIPCCVDLSRYVVSSGQNARVNLGLPDARVMVYVGSLGGWYLTDEMARLFRIGRQIDQRLRFLVLTQDPSRAERALSREGLSPDTYSAKTVSSREVPTHLAACDFGVAFIRPSPSKESSSPTKIGEYLASGLPILANRGIGDLDSLIEGRRLGVLVDDLQDASLADAVRKMLALLDQDPGLPHRCRQAAADEFDLVTVGIQRYLEVYRGLGLRIPLDATGQS